MGEHAMVSSDSPYFPPFCTTFSQVREDLPDQTDLPHTLDSARLQGVRFRRTNIFRKP